MKRLTISHGEISFYGGVCNKCSNQNYPPIKRQLEKGKETYEIKGYEYKSYSTDELKAIYARLAELEDKLESGELVEFPFVREYMSSSGKLYEVGFIDDRILKGGIDYILVGDCETAYKLLEQIKAERNSSKKK